MTFDNRIGRLSKLGMAAVLAVSLVHSSAYASDPGTTTGEMLKIPMGTRAIGMGEAFTALADDSSSLYWNPAGMAMMEQKEASFTQSSLIESVNDEQIAYVAPGDNYAYGTSFSYLGYGSIAGYDNSGNSIGDQSAYSLGWNGGIARQVIDHLFAGITAGWLHEDLAGTTANTIDFNMGAIYRLDYHPFGGNYNLGTSVQNLGPGLKFVDERDSLPTRIKFGGAATQIKELPMNLTFDVTVPNDNVTYIDFGGEYWFRQMFALRLGYAGSNDTGKGLRVGAGLKYGGLLFDYAYASYGDFGAVNRFTLSFRFGEKVHQMNKDERDILKEANKARRQGDYIQSIMAFNELLDKNPDNEHVLGMMIDTHEAMLRQQVGETVTDQTAAIPTPEQMALGDLVPGQAYAETGSAGVISKTADAYDPLGLNNLPDVNTLDSYTASLPKPPEKVPAFKDVVKQETESPIVQQNAAVSKDSVGLPDTNSNNNGPALSPTDIYGN